MPNEAVLFRAEERIGKAIPEEDLTAGHLKQYLEPEDYHPIKQVSISFIYLPIGCDLVGVSRSSFSSSVILLKIFIKTRPLPMKTPS